MNELEKTANSIVNHFMQNCNATVSKKDYDFVRNTITMYLLDKPQQQINN